MFGGLSSTYHWDPESGHFISSTHQRIAEIIKDYDPDLELAWVPPDKRIVGDDKVFAVIDRARNYVVLEFTEEEADHRILARLWNNDVAKQGGPEALWDKMERERIALKAIELKEQLDRRQELLDFAATVIKSPLHSFKHRGKDFKHNGVISMKERD
jgi:hypothetical protein